MPAAQRGLCSRAQAASSMVPMQPHACRQHSLLALLSLAAGRLRTTPRATSAAAHRQCAHLAVWPASGSGLLHRRSLAAAAVPAATAAAARGRQAGSVAAGSAGGGGGVDTVVLVESPAKARKIQQYLGESYTVLASYGHVRDLPPKAGSVDPERNFALAWGPMPGAPERLAALAAALAGARRLLLATDPDREGEAIAWHVLQELQAAGALAGKDVARIAFAEVTPRAVAAALGAPRPVAGPLVEAYLARRALDFLVGFTLSPLLWRKLPGARSAGRVQSVALRLVCERETALEAHRPQEYWTIAASLAGPAGATFQAVLTHVDGQRLDKLAVGSAEAAAALAERVRAARLRVAGVSRRESARNPPAPFTTSTLQQAASTKLGYGAARTMQLAQRLYEGTDAAGEGLITYMRTDGVALADDAVAALRAALQREFGPEYVPAAPRLYKARAKNAQEAHEAIRPTDPDTHPGGGEARALPPEQGRLYDLVWRRALACQAAPARLEHLGVDIEAEDGSLRLRAAASRVLFPGYLAVYAEPQALQQGDGNDDAQAGGGQEGEEAGDAAPAGQQQRERLAAALAGLQGGEALAAAAVAPGQHWTAGPPRFTEASLVRALEEAGIGRPSTYASTLKLLQERGYVAREGGGRALRATSLGRVLTAFLETYFGRYVDVGFTAAMEAQLDQVAGGQAEWRTLLREFWAPFSERCGQVAGVRVSEVIDQLDTLLGPHFFPVPEGGDEAAARACPACGSGRLGLKLSRSGGFIGCSAYPDCSYARPLEVPSHADGSSSDGEDAGGGQGQAGMGVLGTDPASGRVVAVKAGRYGPYVQLGEEGDDSGLPPRRASLSRAAADAGVSLEAALRLLALPRELGAHPAVGGAVTAGIGRFGPFVQHAGLYAPLPQGVDPLAVSLVQALPLLAAKAARLAAKGAKSGNARRASSGAAGSSSSGASEGDAPTPRKGRAKASPKAGTRKGRAAQGKAEPGPGDAAASGAGEANAPKRGRGRPKAVAPLSASALVLDGHERSGTEGQEHSNGAPHSEGESSAGRGRRRKTSSDGSNTPAAAASTPGRRRRVAAEDAAAASSSAPAESASAANGEASTPSAGQIGSKRAFNPFMRFCQEQRGAVKAAHPDVVRAAALTQLLAQRWRALTEGEQEQYRT